MGRERFLDLARRGHRVPIAADLVLRAHADAEAILGHGERLGAVIAEAAHVFDSPLALPLMDLRLEKAELVRLIGVPPAELDTWRIRSCPSTSRAAAGPLSTSRASRCSRRARS